MLKIVSFIFVLVILAVGGNLWKSGLRVKTISVDGVLNVEENQVIQLAGVTLGSSMYDLDLTRIQQNVTSHYFVKDVLVERNLPGTIRLSVTERTPLAIIPGRPMLYIDEEGIVLPPTNARAVYDLPIISGLQVVDTLRPGGHAPGEDTNEAIRLLWTLRHGNRQMFHRISEVHLRNGGDIVLFSSEWGVPIIFGHGRIADKLARLEVFWEEEVAQYGGHNLEYVDVRYDEQVIARWKKSAGVAL
jgi:cell division protein FtsQ